MLYLLIVMSLVFMLIGLIVTENNAKYLLSGYNTMTEIERKSFNISAYIQFFRKFHLFLGFTFLVFGLLLHFAFGSLSTTFFTVIYPILGYIFFLTKSHKYSKGKDAKKIKWGIFILGFTLMFVVLMLLHEVQESKIIIHSNFIEISGSYGENIKFQDIKSIKIVDAIPELSMRVNGSSIGEIKKGYFETKAGNRIKLFVNKSSDKYLLIEMNMGENIYFAPKSEYLENIFNDLKSNEMFSKLIE